HKMRIEKMSPLSVSSTKCAGWERRGLSDEASTDREEKQRIRRGSALQLPHTACFHPTHTDTQTHTHTHTHTASFHPTHTHTHTHTQPASTLHTQTHTDTHRHTPIQTPTIPITC